ncbi:hypothetical protein JTB14_003353 [Gonioctena quinquepunctata]|nr:hypothetical protein JTB14_003353 [Gonioctena quinquepunctata]
MVCPENFCAEFTCEEEVCGKGEMKTPGICGCCEVCKKVLGEGESCDLLGGAILSPQPPNAVCGENMICYENKCQKEKDVVAGIAHINE